MVNQSGALDIEQFCKLCYFFVRPFARRAEAVLQHCLRSTYDAFQTCLPAISEFIYWRWVSGPSIAYVRAAARRNVCRDPRQPPQNDQRGTRGGKGAESTNG